MVHMARLWMRLNLYKFHADFADPGELDLYVGQHHSDRAV